MVRNWPAFYAVCAAIVVKMPNSAIVANIARTTCLKREMFATGRFAKEAYPRLPANRSARRSRLNASATRSTNARVLAGKCVREA